MRTIDMSENNHGSCTGNHSVYLSEVRVRNDKKCKQNRPDRDAGPELILEDTIIRLKAAFESNLV